MFNIGPMEFIMIAVVAVIFIGPEKLPETLKKFGRFFVQAKRHANDVKGNFDEVLRDAEREIELERIRDLQKKLQSDIETMQVIDTTHENRGSSSSQTPALPPGEYDAEGHEIPGGHNQAAQDSNADPFSPEVLEKAHKDLHIDAPLPSPDVKKES